jgi:hypothetical protein
VNYLHCGEKNTPHYIIPLFRVVVKGFKAKKSPAEDFGGGIRCVSIKRNIASLGHVFLLLGGEVKILCENPTVGGDEHVEGAGIGEAGVAHGVGRRSLHRGNAVSRHSTKRSNGRGTRKRRRFMVDPPYGSFILYNAKIRGSLRGKIIFCI